MSYYHETNITEDDEDDPVIYNLMEDIRHLKETLQDHSALMWADKCACKFEKGDDFIIDMERLVALKDSAGIHVTENGIKLKNRIEVHGEDENHARALRDKVLAALELQTSNKGTGTAPQEGE